MTAPTTRQVGLFDSNLAVTGRTVYLFAGGTEANASPGVFSSSDGGRHWTPVATDPCGPAKGPQNDPYYASDSTVADDGSVIADCLGSGVRVAARGSGRFSALRPYPVRSAIGIEGAQSADRIVIADTSRMYGPGREEAVFYVTSDGGRTWERTQMIAIGGTIGFLPGGYGFAVGQDGSDRYVTDDGGRTWHREQYTA